METTAARIRSARQRAGLSQSQLADRLSVSRQAVTKWENGGGLPDVENLKAMARLFDVSVDYLLVDTSPDSPTATTLRQPIDLASYAPHRIRGKLVGSRAHAAVLDAYPDASEVWALSRVLETTRKQNVVEWLSALAIDTPFGLFGTTDAVNNHDADYLVTKPHQQVLVRVGKHELESRELNETITAASFTLGHDRFRRTTQVR